MPRETAKPDKHEPQMVTKLTLAEFRRRLAKAKSQTVNFSEKDQYGKPTRRLPLPETFLAAFEGLSRSARATLGFEGQGLLLPVEVWDEYLAETGENLAKLGCEHFLEELIRNSELIPIDTKGRITLSKLLVKGARLKDEVLLWAGRTIEIWDEPVHDDYRHKLLLALSSKVGFPMNSQNGSARA